VRDPWSRAQEVERLGADSVYLHYGADQRRADPSRDSTQWIEDVVQVVKVPVGAGTFGVEDGVRAAELGADVIVIGHPLISGPDPLAALREFCERVRAAYRPAERALPRATDNPPTARCSFCGRDRRVTGPMVEGPGGIFMCAACVAAAGAIARQIAGPPTR
jgi:hypothetical protein